MSQLSSLKRGSNASDLGLANWARGYAGLSTDGNTNRRSTMQIIESVRKPRVEIVQNSQRLEVAVILRLIRAAGFLQRIHLELIGTDSDNFVKRRRVCMQVDLSPRIGACS